MNGKLDVKLIFIFIVLSGFIGMEIDANFKTSYSIILPIALAAAFIIYEIRATQGIYDYDEEAEECDEEGQYGGEEDCEE
ncbi:MAG: hypothetical protein R3Y65_05625 [Bacillota bacterium]